MKEKFRKKIIGSCMFVICLTAILLFIAIPTEASDTINDGIKLVTIENYTKADLESEISKQRNENYVYAGLYKAGTDTVDNLVARNVVTAPKDSTDTEKTTYVAKFVPEGVMGIKAQVSGTLLSNPEAETSSVRFVTAVDSLLYKEIGFSITRSGDNGETIELVKPGTISKYVYLELYGVDVTAENPGEPMKYTPQDIHALANYFKTYTISNVPTSAFNTDLTVTPYWVTHDDVKVEGTKAIKSVNFGRSWVYVNVTPNADEEEFGTYEHPFTNLSDALDSVLLENNGKVIAKGNNLITVSDTFEWTEHTVTVGDAEKKCNITITGEDASAGFDFSAFNSLYINDNVVFDNMTLMLPEKEYVYANGNKFVITSTVTSDNDSTTIFGGGNNATLTSGTNIEIHAGNYYMIFGGNKDGGSITGDIHVTVTNANVFNANEADKNRVFGGGWGKSTVNGDIYVTVGQGFNKDYSQSVSNYGIAGGDHKRRSAVFGAGAGGEIVKGSTYVTIKDDAKVDFVYGGGTASSGIVEDTCHVTLQGGTVFSIYGGAQGDDAVTDATKYRNRDTSVVVTGGEVWQIMGGNGSGMVGNTYVEISGGQVHRRIYGGCYSDTKYVDGHTTVVINKSDSLAFDTSYTEKLYAGSQNTGNTEEIKTLIFNDTYDEDKLCSSKDYNYLVQANEGGVVSSIGTRLSVTPNDENNAIVRLDNDTTGSLHAYMTSKGMCALPELNANTSKREVYVVFGTEQLDAEALSGYEAKVGGTHFDTLENAIAEAKELSDVGGTEDGKVTVTLLKDVEIDTVLSVGGAYDIILQSETNNKYSITTSDTGDNVITVYGTLTINNVDIKGGKHGIYVGNSGKLYSVEAENLQGVSISNTALKGLYVDGGIVDIYKLTVSETGEQAVQFQNKAKATISNYNVIGTSSSVAVRIMTGADVTLNDGTINANTTYGIYMDGTASKVTATDTKVIRGANNTTNPLVGVASATSQFAFNETEGGEAYIDGQSYGGRGVEVAGTFVLNGGTIRNNKAESGAGVNVQEGATFTMTGGTISGNTATSYGAGVCAVGSFTMNGGEISDNTATTQGGGVYVNASTFTMTDGSISDNTAKTGGGVYVPASSVFTMKSGIISGNTATDTTSGGGGVYVDTNGTFNMSSPERTGMPEGVIKENVAYAFGAGVLVKGEFTMDAGAISDHGSKENPLAVEGTGVCLSGDSAKFTMSGGKISYNYANNKAGAGVSMYTGETTFTMNGGEISNNHTTGNASGIVLRKQAKFTMNEGATISNNTAGAGKVGGGISMDGTATFILNGGTFSGNIVGNENNDINLTSASAYIKLEKQLTSDIYVSPKTYANTTKIAEKEGDITNELFIASMKYVKVKPATDGNWYVNEQGMLTKGPVLLQSTGKGYATLSEALEVAAEGDTITILENTEIVNKIAITKNLQLTSNKAVTVTANDTLSGGMFDITGGTLEIKGTSEDAKIVIAAGKQTTNIIYTNGGNATLENVELAGNQESTANKNSTYGIYNNAGNVVAKSVVIKDIVKGDGINIRTGATVDLDNVAISNTGRYGLKTYGTVNIYNTIHSEHALTIQNAYDHAIDIDNAGQVNSVLTNVPEHTYAINIDTTEKDSSIGILVRAGGNIDISSIRVKDTQRQGVYFYGTSATKTASGTISEFEISGTGLKGDSTALSEGAIELKYSTASLTNGVVTSGTYCIKTDANSTLTTLNVSVKTTGTAAALSISGTKKGDDIIILE